MTLIYICVSIWSMKIKKDMNKITYLFSILIVSAVFAGCGFVPEVSLTEEQQDLVSEYSAGLLMKYNKGHSNGLQWISDVKFEDLNITPTPTPIPEVIDAPNLENGEVAEGVEVTQTEDISGEIPETAEEENSVDITTIPMNEALGLYEATVNASYIELVDTYPANDEELVLAMKATEGYELLIIHFDIENNTGQELNLSTNIGNRKIRVLLNGEEKIRCEMTLLSNDLLNYSNVVAPGVKDDAVLVFEKKKNIEVNSITLVLVNSEEELKYNLY